MIAGGMRVRYIEVVNEEMRLTVPWVTEIKKEY